MKVQELHSHESIRRCSGGQPNDSPTPVVKMLDGGPQFYGPDGVLA